MNKQIYSVFFFTLLVFSFSCNKVIQDIRGSWAIDYLEYNNKEVLMLGNGIFFKGDSVKYPFLFSDTINNKRKESLYYLIENDNKSYSIVFETENPIFKGTHYLKFYKISNLKGDYGLKMTIYSEKFYMESTKLIIFGKDDDFYNTAENLTKYSPPPKYEVARTVNQ